MTTKEEELSEIRFGDLSFGLQLFVVLGWIAIFFNVIVPAAILLLGFMLLAMGYSV